LDGLGVVIDGESRYTKAVPTLVDPTQAKAFPILSVTAAPEVVGITLQGVGMDRSLKVDIFGFTDGGARDTQQEPSTKLFDASEDLIEAIIQKLTDPDWLEMVNCVFSITQIGPVVCEHMEAEDPFAYISVPLAIDYFDGL
jgi:hypothetical protein